MRFIGLFILVLLFPGVLCGDEAKVRMEIPGVQASSYSNEESEDIVGFEFPKIGNEVHYEGGRPIVVVHAFTGGGLETAYAPGVAQLAGIQLNKGMRSLGDSGTLRGRKVAVLGSGANALAIANDMARQGCQVTVYGSGFEETARGDYDVALWPYHGVAHKHGGVLKELQRRSFGAYMQWAKDGNSPYTAVNLADVYAFDDGQPFGWHEGEGLVTPVQHIEVEFNNNAKHMGQYYQMFEVDKVGFTRNLLDIGNQLGVRYHDEGIGSIQELLKMKVDVVFNCMKADPYKTVRSQAIGSTHGRRLIIEGQGRFDSIFYINHGDGVYTYCVPKGDGFEIIMLTNRNPRFLPYAEGIAMRFNEFVGKAQEERLYAKADLTSDSTQIESGVEAESLE